MSKKRLTKTNTKSYSSASPIRSLKRSNNCMTKQEKALDIIKELVPKQIGVQSAYYKLDGNTIEVAFVVQEKHLPTLIGYLNSLPAIIEENIKGIKMESGIFIHQRNKEVQELTQRDYTEAIPLRSLSYAS